MYVYFKGMGMGAADVVPGVSGGTIALITGIYEEFINALKSFSDALIVLKEQGWKAAWAHINGPFLITLFAGIATSLVLFLQLIKYALEFHPILLWSFFFGLIVASCYYVGLRVKIWNAASIIALVGGTVLIYYVTSISPAQTPTSWWFIFISGALAICAMLLPGISGAFILVLLGKYAYIIDSISQFNFKVVGLFALGCLTGLLSFSHLLSYMLKRFESITIALLTGFMIGSLNKIWPWKKTLSWGVDRHGEKIAVLQENVWPAAFEDGEARFFPALFCMLIGFALIVVLEKSAIVKGDET
jgi:putative membrane protein